MIIEKLRTALWFAQRPNHWRHATELACRNFRTNMDRSELRKQAGEWAATHARPVGDALRHVGLLNKEVDTPVPPAVILDEGSMRVEHSAVKMGGPGDLDLLYAAVSLSNASRVVETGVAYGWSSLAILSALEGRERALLVSVDMPYPKMNNEAFVGIVVPERLRRNWEIIREPDRCGLEKAIMQQGGTIDLCHYDSDKSWWGRQYAYPLLWNALKLDGVFISDDIQDNMAFAEFVNEHGIDFAVTESGGKYVGIMKK